MNFRMMRLRLCSTVSVWTKRLIRNSGLDLWWRKLFFGIDWRFEKALTVRNCEYKMSPPLYSGGLFVRRCLSERDGMQVNNRCWKRAVLAVSLLFLTGCEKSPAETEIVELDAAAASGLTAEEAAGASGSEALLDAFLASEVAAVYEDGREQVIWFDELPHEEDWAKYTVGERIDLDNDGEREQIIKGPYGGIYLDVRDNLVYVLTKGDGTGMMLSYTNYDNAVWIVHRDTLHGGRQIYRMTKYDGGEHIVDEFVLSAQYWDAPPNGSYDEDSDFSYRGEAISMEEYEALLEEIFGW